MAAVLGHLYFARSIESSITVKVFFSGVQRHQSRLGPRLPVAYSITVLPSEVILIQLKLRFEGCSVVAQFPQNQFVFSVRRALRMKARLTNPKLGGEMLGTDLG